MAEATVMLIVATLLELTQKEAQPGRRPVLLTPCVAHCPRPHGRTGWLRTHRARKVERRLQGWGVKVQAADPHVPGTRSLDDLLRTSDVVSLHVVLTSETGTMIGARELALMQPSAILVPECDADRVVLTPHSSGHNLETDPTGVQMAFDNIDRALRGELPESVVNPDVIPAWRRGLAMLRP
jgi:phosphoglycerate dehydrogenase-like enzyme